ncbi:MAG TPA: tRNA lysidine(34) synthetase TilS [Planctomicrobium sp.]|nr:tRNA lysidine(34) synthetase TilS [Planctomicrobium sp.]
MISVLHHALRESLKLWAVRESRLLIGVSGGADSVALLRGLVDLQDEFSFRLAVAHYDHALRTESSEDARWVKELCESLQLPCFSERRPVTSEDQNLPEESARRLRYEFLTKVALAQNCRFVAVAHTADDQVETVFHHLIRGTGLAGLSGIPSERPLTENITLIRPLRNVRRSELVAALAEWNQPFLTDSSNTDRRYTRNRIRHDLLPQLREKLNPQVDEALLRLSVQAMEAQDVIRQLADELLSRASLDVQPCSIRLNRVPFEASPLLVVREALRQLWERGGWPRQNLSFSHLDQLAGMLKTGAPSRVCLPQGVEAICRGSLLELRRDRDNCEL